MCSEAELWGHYTAASETQLLRHTNTHKISDLVSEIGHEVHCELQCDTESSPNGTQALNFSQHYKIIKQHSKNTPAQSGLDQVFKVCSHFSLNEKVKASCERGLRRSHLRDTDCSRVWQRQLHTASYSQSSMTHPVIRKCGQGTGLGITHWHPQLYCWLSLGDSQITWLIIYLCHNTYLGLIPSAALVQEPISLFSPCSIQQRSGLPGHSSITV